MSKCAECKTPTNRPKFCSNSCKDNYHNKWNPRGLHKFAPVGGYKENPIYAKEPESELHKYEVGDDHGQWED